MSDGHTDVELGLPASAAARADAATLRERFALVAFDRTALANVSGIPTDRQLKLWTLHCVRAADLMVKALDLTPDQVKLRLESYANPHAQPPASGVKVSR